MDAVLIPRANWGTDVGRGPVTKCLFAAVSSWHDFTSYYYTHIHTHTHTHTQTYVHVYVHVRIYVRSRPTSFKFKVQNLQPVVHRKWWVFINIKTVCCKIMNEKLKHFSHHYRYRGNFARCKPLLRYSRKMKTVTAVITVTLLPLPR